ncbi:MAG: hypothetical protein GMKNLPBB_01233 [Myxococcota bacterium]|nr:hypothetical protein [Myxococcota bacterium]
MSEWREKFDEFRRNLEYFSHNPPGPVPLRKFTALLFKHAVVLMAVVPLLLVIMGIGLCASRSAPEPETQTPREEAAAVPPAKNPEAPPPLVRLDGETVPDSPRPATPSIPTEPHLAFPYKPVKSRDHSVAGRSRYEWRVISEAATAEERAHTVMKVALDLQKNTDAQAVMVALEPSPELAGKGFELATAVFAPDGKGWTGKEQGKNWIVDATGETLDRKSVKAASTWYDVHKKFTNRKGVTDENKLNLYVAKKHRISVADLKRRMEELGRQTQTKIHYRVEEIKPARPPEEED